MESAGKRRGPEDYLSNTHGGTSTVDLGGGYFERSNDAVARTIHGLPSSSGGTSTVDLGGGYSKRSNDAGARTICGLPSSQTHGGTSTVDLTTGCDEPFNPPYTTTRSMRGTAPAQTAGGGSSLVFESAEGPDDNITQGSRATFHDGNRLKLRKDRQVRAITAPPGGASELVNGNGTGLGGATYVQQRPTRSMAASVPASSLVGSGLSFDETSEDVKQIAQGLPSDV